MYHLELIYYCYDFRAKSETSGEIEMDEKGFD